MLLGKLRSGLLMLVCAVAVAACSDASLVDFGVTDDWLGEPRPVGIASDPTVPGSGAVNIASLEWYTPEASAVDPDPDAVIAQIWERSSGGDAFVQAAPNEISAAVPTIKVPEAVPPGTRFVTSQLVYGISTGRLTNIYVAAFGFWFSEPYATSRSVSQVMQLKVAEDDTNPSPDPADPTLGCGRFSDADVAVCDAVGLSGARAWWVVSLDGATLTWFDGGYRYELLDRQNLGRDQITEIARSMILLSDVAIREQTES